MNETAYQINKHIQDMIDNTVNAKFQEFDNRIKVLEDQMEQLRKIHR